MEVAKRPDINLLGVKSSQIAEIGHCPVTNTLAIRFKTKSGPGSVYHYTNFTAEQFAKFSTAESIGRHFGEHVKGKYDFVKIGEKQD